MSFEHTMNRVYTSIHAFTVNSRLDVAIFSMVIIKTFCPVQVSEKLATHSSSFLSSYVPL